MSDNKTVVEKKVNQPVVEKHFERRWIEAKGELLKDAGPVVDFFISLHEQCKAVAGKHKVDAHRLTVWLLDQLPIEELRSGNFDEEEEEEEIEDEDEDDDDIPSSTRR